MEFYNAPAGAVKPELKILKGVLERYGNAFITAEV